MIRMNDFIFLQMSSTIETIVAVVAVDENRIFEEKRKVMGVSRSQRLHGRLFDFVPCFRVVLPPLPSPIFWVRASIYTSQHYGLSCIGLSTRARKRKEGASTIWAHTPCRESMGKCESALLHYPLIFVFVLLLFCRCYPILKRSMRL